jgi:hypothetical protein
VHSLFTASTVLAVGSRDTSPTVSRTIALPFLGPTRRRFDKLLLLLLPQPLPPPLLSTS